MLNCRFSTHRFSVSFRRSDAGNVEKRDRLRQMMLPEQARKEDDMRTAHHNVGIIGDPPFGVSLGFDFCAEHEWGIKNIKAMLGVNDKAGPGIARRTMGRNPEAGMYLTTLARSGKNRKEVRLAFGITDSPHDLAELSSRKLATPRDTGKDMSAAWNDGSFLIRGFSQAAQDMLHEIHDAFARRDLSIGLGGAAIFGNAPLNIAIVSRIPQDVLDGIEARDRDHEALLAAAEKTGIRKRVDASSRQYFALKPAWTERFKSLAGREGRPADDTKHPVMFWLNPMHQNIHSYGWYTVEELDAWIKGEGPIIKANKPQHDAEPSL